MAMMSKTQRGIRPTVIPCPADQLNSLLTTEWLRTNSMGAYASSSVIGCNSRRYHGLLVASLKPPLGRIVALSTIMEQLVIGKKIYDLATNEFVNTFSPEGYLLQVEFRDDTTATFVYEVEGVRLTKRVLLSNSANAVLVRYELSDKNAKLLLRPFTPMRDFHALRSYSDRTEFVSEPTQTGVIVKNCSEDIPPLYLTSEQAEFHSDPQWWYRVQYRIDLSRGQDGYEDLYSPGLFVWKPGKKKSCKISASIGQAIDVKYKPVLEARRNTQAEYTKILSNAPRPIRRLAAACEPFLVDRWSLNGMR